MDNKYLIELITREVLSTMKNSANEKLPSPPAPFSTVPSYSYQNNSANVKCAGRSLIVLTGISNMRENFYKMVSGANLKFDVLMSEGARAAFDVNEIRSKLMPAELYLNFTYGDRTAFLEKYDTVIMPFMSLSALDHIASLNTDSMVCNYVVWHMIRNKKLIVSAEPLLNQVGSANPAIIREINQKIAKITELGVAVMPLANIFGGAVSQCESGSQRGAANANSLTTCSASSHNCVSCGQCFTRRESDVNIIKNAGASRISAAPGVGAAPGAFDSALASMIDHTLLKPDAKESDFDKLCDEARKYKFASVCVNPSWVKFCKDRLRNSGVMVCTVVGFPLGATSTSAKVCETIQAVTDGADEIDMVINIGALKSGNTKIVEDDIHEVVKAANGRTVKVILETSLLTDEEKVTACRLSKNAKAHFVKTSTGFGGGGATANDIALMRKTVGPDMGVKASGGIRDLQTAQTMIAAGATRVGASASVAIVSGMATDKKGY